MKKLKSALILILALAATPLLAQRYSVTSDADESAPFDTYKTYAWAQHVTTTNSLAYAINDVVLKSKIQDAVAHELDARDITMTDQNPDMLVNFRVFEKPIKVTEADGYFHDSKYWNDKEIKEPTLGSLPIASSTYENDNQYYFDKGTILVQVVDAKKGVVVWQGYASGLSTGNIFDKQPEHIAKAVRLIFDKYDYVLK